MLRSSNSQPFHVMVKPRGAICNLDCEYCFFLSKESLYPGSSFRMPDDVLESYTRQYIESQPTSTVTFAWQGGEPTLMGLDFFRRAVELQQKYRKPGTVITNSLQTNGVLIDDEWAVFFRQNNFLLGVSLDGPAHLHDIYRIDKGKQGTHDRVRRGIATLQKHGVQFNILCCVSAGNAGHALEVYTYLKDQVGAQFMQFIPIVERENQTGFQEGTRVTPRSVSGSQYGRFLIEIFNEWVRRDVGKVYVQIFDVALSVWFGQPAGLCIFEETCGNALAMEHNGDLYSCDHFVEPNYFLGNIQEENLLPLAASKDQTAFGLAKQNSLPQYCRKCEVRFICNGGCPKDRIRRTPDGEPGLNYLCEGYKAFFTHIDQPMKIMTALLRQKRPPAEIMDLMASEPVLAAPPPTSKPAKKRGPRRGRRSAGGTVP